MIQARFQEYLKSEKIFGILVGMSRDLPLREMLDRGSLESQEQDRNGGNEYEIIERPKTRQLEGAGRTGLLAKDSGSTSGCAIFFFGLTAEGGRWTKRNNRASPGVMQVFFSLPSNLQICHRGPHVIFAGWCGWCSWCSWCTFDYSATVGALTWLKESTPIRPCRVSRAVRSCWHC